MRAVYDYWDGFEQNVERHGGYTEWDYIIVSGWSIC